MNMQFEANCDLEPAATPEMIRNEVKAVYEELDQEIRAIGPNCQLSGRCCRFAEYGHTLFVSGPEFEVLIAEAPPPVRALDQGETCPWQDLAGRCTAREARPLGCRVYYCDPTFQSESPKLTERFLGKLKGLANRFGLPWNYAPLHVHTGRAAECGKLALPTTLKADHGPTTV